MAAFVMVFKYWLDETKFLKKVVRVGRQSLKCVLDVSVPQHPKLAEPIDPGLETVNRLECGIGFWRDRAIN
jgi:hypothetical protein